MRPRAEDLARENCTKGGCAHVSANGQECKGCGFDADKLQRRRSLPLVPLPSGLTGKVVAQQEELRGQWELTFDAPLYYLTCSVCGAKARDQIHGDAECEHCHAKMETRWMREEANDDKEASG